MINFATNNAFAIHNKQNISIMKRISVVLLLMIAALAANAQQKGYVCTGNYVNVRTGPGKNFEVYDSDTSHKRQLSKGDVVANCGKRKNGFCLVQGPLEWGGGMRRL